MSSRLERVKNIPLAIEAFKKVVEQEKNTGLIILGDGTEKKPLIKLVKNLDLEKNIIFEGWQENVLQYLKSADLFLNTSNHEGCGFYQSFV